MESERSADRKAHRESLDVVFWLRPEELTRSTVPVRHGGHDSDGGALAPAQHAGEVLHAVASAISEIPFGEVHGIEIRRITDLALEEDASFDAPLEVRARGVGKRELTAGRQVVTMSCELTNHFGACVAAFSVEIEAKADAPAASKGPDSASDSAAAPEPDLECVDNIPV